MRKWISKTFIHVLLGIYAFVSLYPLIWMCFYSFKNNEEIFVTNPFGLPKVWRFDNYIRAVKQFDIMIYFKNSLVVTSVTIVITTFCALLFCYVVARMRNRVTRFLHSFVISGMFIPIQAIMIPLVITVRQFSATNSYMAVILPYTVLGYPLACMLMYTFYLGIPVDMEESAYLEGASFIQTYFKIIFPQMKSIICVLAVYEFMTCWNEFSLALVLLTKNEMKTLPLGLASFFGEHSAEWGVVGASMIISSIPVLIAYLFFSNQITDAVAVSGMKN